MSSLTRTRVLETQGEDCENSVKRKRTSGNNSDKFCKKTKSEENMSDAAKQKRANFSALTPTVNGLNRTTNVASLKPGAAKKLTIKNLKG